MFDQMYYCALKMLTLFDLVVVIEGPRCIGTVTTHDKLSSFTTAAGIQTPDLQVVKEMRNQMYHSGLRVTS